MITINDNMMINGEEIFKRCLVDDDEEEWREHEVRLYLTCNHLGVYSKPWNVNSDVKRRSIFTVWKHDIYDENEIVGNKK